MTLAFAVGLLALAGVPALATAVDIPGGEWRESVKGPGDLDIGAASCDELTAELSKSESELRATQKKIKHLNKDLRDLKFKLEKADPESKEGEKLTKEIKSTEAKKKHQKKRADELRDWIDNLKVAIANKPCPPEAPATQPPPNQPPVITAFTADFPAAPGCDTCTGYAVEATDEDLQTLTYTWSKRPPDGAPNPEHTNCGTFTPNFPFPSEAIWDHPNGEPTDTPPGCDHPATKHPGWITVVVTDAQGLAVSCTYKDGSAPTSTSDPATNCT